MAATGEVLVQTRCKQGKLIVTASEVRIELPKLPGTGGFGLRQRSLRRSAISRVDTQVGVISVFGLGGGINITFHGQTPDDVLQADLVPPREAKRIVEMLQG